MFRTVAAWLIWPSFTAGIAYVAGPSTFKLLLCKEFYGIFFSPKAKEILHIDEHY